MNLAEDQPANAAAPKSAAGRAFMAILLLALVLRVVWALAVPVQPTSDSTVYDLLATNLANGQGYVFEPGKPTAFWPVGTSFIYSLLYRAFGHHYLPIVVLNLVLGMGIVALTMLLARRWFDQRIAIVAGLLLALWPSQIEFTTVLASEFPFMLAILAALATWTSPRMSLWLRSIFTGLMLSAAGYVRPTALALPAVFAIIHLVQHKRLLQTIAAVILVGAVMALCIAPWSIRNTRAFGQFVLISTNGGAVSWMGNNPETDNISVTEPQRVRHLPEVQRDRVLGQEAKDYIRQYPGRFVIRTCWKMARLHERESIGVGWNQKALVARFGGSITTALKLLSNVYWWIVLLLGVVGLVVLAVRRGLIASLTHPAVLLWAYFTIIHGITAIQDRYHFPSIPSIAMLAALAISSWRQRGHESQIEAATNITSVNAPAMKL